MKTNGFTAAGKTNPKQTQSNPIKPNLKKVKMNVGSVKTKDYRNESRLRPPAKQTQSNPISLAILSAEFCLNARLAVPAERSRTIVLRASAGAA